MSSLRVTCGACGCDLGEVLSTTVAQEGISAEVDLNLDYSIHAADCPLGDALMGDRVYRGSALLDEPPPSYRFRLG